MNFVALKNTQKNGKRDGADQGIDKHRPAEHTPADEKDRNV